MDLEMYKRRLGAKDSSEALVNASRKHVQLMFKNSPLYKVVQVDGVDKGVRVNYLKDNQKELLLQPDDSASKGEIVTIESESWLVTEFTPNLAYPKAKLAYCNQLMKWSDSGSTYECPCVADGSNYQLDESGNYMPLPEGDLVVKAPYNLDTARVSETQRFVFGRNTYEVVGIDDISNIQNGKGIVEFTLEIVSKSEEDGDVADNNNDNGWGGGW
jgi:hypothetical protein